MRRNQISSFARNGPVHLNRPMEGVSSVDCWPAEVCGISGSDAGYTVFRGSVKSTGYPLHSSVFPLHFPSRVSPCAITFQLESAGIGFPLLIRMLGESTAEGSLQLLQSITNEYLFYRVALLTERIN